MIWSNGSDIRIFHDPILDANAVCWNLVEAVSGANGFGMDPRQIPTGHAPAVNVDLDDPKIR